jgi:hypothetical protein
MEGPHVQEHKRTTQEGEPQREHQVPQQVCTEDSQLQMCFNFQFSPADLCFIHD